MDKVANKANRGKPDPITNRRMTDGCWNSNHFGSSSDKRCDGYLPSGAKCECLCHEGVSRTKTSRKAQQAKTMDILDSGCGTIDIK